jgi:hypothetical protein
LDQYVPKKAITKNITTSAANVATVATPTTAKNGAVDAKRRAKTTSRGRGTICEGCMSTIKIIRKQKNQFDSDLYDKSADFANLLLRRSHQWYSNNNSLATKLLKRR